MLKTPAAFLASIAILTIVDGLAAPSAEQLGFFESKVRPLLADQCYRCHSHRAEKLKGGLYLDHGSRVLAGGDAGPVIVPGEPEESLLVEAVRYKNPELQMPPKKKLADEEIAVLEKWVAMGAPWPEEPAPRAEKKLGPKHFDLAARKSEHWCWQPIPKAAPPAVEDRSWSSDPIDLHILAKLEEKDLKPSPPADKRALIRRAYFDLTGLPPSADQVEAFVADSSPDAFELVVDALLASPHFGERWARHWMDSVRYAESCGHEFDYAIPHAAAYRDYLIRAFNADVPYDQFVTEHVAGDLLGNPRRHPDEAYNESVIGTGFWHFHEATHAPTDVRGDEADRVDNQIDVFSKTFLGVTVSCARCHDHMFDAISTKDYYALAGYLQSSRRHEAFLDPGKKIEAGVVKLKALAQKEAELKQVPKTADPDALSRYLMAAREAADSARNPDLGAVAAKHRVDPKRLAGWVRGLQDEGIAEPGHPLYPWAQVLPPGTAQSGKGFADKFKSVASELAKAKERREKMLENGTLLPPPSEWLREGNAFDALSSERLHGVLHSPTFDLDGEHIVIRARVKKGGISIRLIIDGYWMEPFNGLLFRGTRLKDVDTAGDWKWLHLGGDLKLHQGRRAHLEIVDHGDGSAEIGEAWVANGGGGAPPEVSAIAERIVSNPKIASLKDFATAYGRLFKRALEGEDDSPDLLAWLREYGLATPERDAALAELDAERKRIEKTIPTPRRVQALTDGSPENEFVFLRGSHKRLGDEVPRRFLTALGGEAIEAPQQGSGRLQLAKQVVHPENPLTPRVITNRLWHHLFGRGIVPSTDDFGVLGKLPSHPELLDHLAASLVADGWSIKRAIRRMMLTKTYQQASAAGGKGDEIDPENLLLHRANLRRLQGEAIRDSILAISGRLDRKMFGGSVPVHLTEFMTGRGRPKGGPLDGAGRRSIYIAVRRNFLSPMMLAFDTPIPFSSMGRRSVSNVPAQALIMMNDPLVHEQASLWAKRIAAMKLEPPAAIGRMYIEAFARPPSSTEIADGIAFLNDVGGGDALRDYAHVLFNTKEFVFLN